MCGYWRRADDLGAELELDQVREGLRKLHIQGCRAVNFTGGEPTLRTDLEEIIRAASHLGMWTSMVTNGTQLSRERIGRLRDTGLDNLLLSFDSMDPRKHDGQRGIDGCHAAVVKCLGWLAEEFLVGHRSGGIMCVITKHNLDEIPSIVRFAGEHGVLAVFQPYHARKTGCTSLTLPPEERTMRVLANLERDRQNVLSSPTYLRGFSRFIQGEALPRCQAGRKYCSVDPFGGLHPCVDLPSAGNVLRDEVSVVRSPEAIESVRGCSGCWYSFRGESEASLSWVGVAQRLRLLLRLVRQNRRRRVSAAARLSSRAASSSWGRGAAGR